MNKDRQNDAPMYIWLFGGGGLCEHYLWVWYGAKPQWQAAMSMCVNKTLREAMSRSERI